MLIQGEEAHHDDHEATSRRVAPDLLERVETLRGRARPVRRVPRHGADREGARPQGLAALGRLARHRPHRGDDGRRRQHRQVRRIRRQPRGDRHEEQPRGGGGDRPPGCGCATSAASSSSTSSTWCSSPTATSCLRRLIECLSRDRTKHQVAEVTSLGLVQMTRKKLGLGLLETFSEPCEVCAGRGIIVHHDPVVKHRARGIRERRLRPSAAFDAPPPRRRRRPAARTCSPRASSRRSPRSPRRRSTMQTRSRPTRSWRRRSSRSSAPRPHRRRSARSARSARSRQRPKSEKDLLLDSVLSALPEPKAPGQGRGRRRVTTAALHGHPGRPHNDGELGLSADRGRARPQSGGDEPPDQRVPVHVLGAGGDQPRERLVRDVVVIQVESAARDAVGGREGMELIERGVTHQVRPQPAVRRPARIVDEDRHDPSLGRPAWRAARWECAGITRHDLARLCAIAQASE